MLLHPTGGFRRLDSLRLLPRNRLNRKCCLLKPCEWLALEHIATMKRHLNPNLVRENCGHDLATDVNEHWVFLRNPKTVVGGREVGIGPLEIQETQESALQKNTVAQQIRETEHALAALANVKPEADPHLILTKDCFG